MIPCHLQKAHADVLASEMDEEQLTEEQKEDLKRIRLRKKQVSGGRRGWGRAALACRHCVHYCVRAGQGCG